MKRAMNKMIAAILFLLFGAIVFAMAPSVKALDTSKVQVVGIKKITDEGYYRSSSANAPMKFSPDEKKIYAPFIDMNQKKWGWAVMNLNGTERKVRWDGFPESFSPDGTRYVCENSPRHHIEVSNLDGSNKLTVADFRASKPRWSPVGNKIVFKSAGKFYIVSPEGGDLELLYDFNKYQIKGSPIWGLAWSFDGKSLAIGSSRNLQWRKIDTEKGVTIYTVGEDPIWSPDGKTIYSKTGDLEVFDIETMSVSEDLTESDSSYVGAFDINFNVDLIVSVESEFYINPKTGKKDPHLMLSHIWIMNMDGSGKKKLTSGMELLINSVTISSDGRYIIFEGEDIFSPGVADVYTIELAYE